MLLQGCIFPSDPEHSSFQQSATSHFVATVKAFLFLSSVFWATTVLKAVQSIIWYQACVQCRGVIAMHGAQTVWIRWNKSKYLVCLVTWNIFICLCRTFALCSGVSAGERRSGSKCARLWGKCSVSQCKQCEQLKKRQFRGSLIKHERGGLFQTDWQLTLIYISCCFFLLNISLKLKRKNSSTT